MTAFLIVWLLVGQQPDPRLMRLRSVIRAYLIESGYPDGRPGYVVDHKIPLCAGGPDASGNLQWQERQASYRKDVFERQLCVDMKAQGLWIVTVSSPKP